MRIYVPDMGEFFSWMEQENHLYAVMRGFEGFAQKYPQPGSHEDIDLMVEDRSLIDLYRRYGHYSKKQGVKCDLHNVSGQNPVTLLPQAERKNWKNKFYPEKVYPEKLSRAMLQGREKWNDRFCVPSASLHLAGLLFHIAYQKAEESGIHMDDPKQSAGSKYINELNTLTQKLGIELEYTLNSFHAYLKRVGYDISYPLLAQYLRGAFAGKKHSKSYFQATVCNDMVAGEMNLFVIRQAAVKTKTAQEILDALRQQYDILAVKEIPLWTRLTKSRQMRGNKWRRGGYPTIAVVVYDPAPLPVSDEDRKVQGMVFNARQFMKRDLRSWFTQKTGKKASCNPIHSTDNEAEAIGHLPMFFSAEEESDIFRQLDVLRQEPLKCAN